jgi:hypothetical protein
MLDRFLLIAAFSCSWCQLPAQSLRSVTSLADPGIEYSVPKRGYHVLRRAGIQAVVVDNRAVDDAVLKDHRAGYSGIASLTTEARRSNMFVPRYAGLNFEHIHDGTTRDRDILFEPRRDPMQLRVISDHVVDLYQAPTKTWQLESVTRYAMLEDGTIEMTFECIPRANTFQHNYIGLFWANYINQPESLDIHFLAAGTTDAPPSWIRGVTPQHGVLATHVGINDQRHFTHDAEFPLTLVFNRSQHRYSEPWYFGISGEMALALMFRPRDQIRFAQSPSGGGQGNPAWDFQWFINDYQVDRLYRMKMRAAYLPYQSHQQIESATSRHRAELAENE